MWRRGVAPFVERWLLAAAWQLPDPAPGGIASPRSVVLEAHDRPEGALCYVHNYRPVPGARGRAPSPRQVPTQFPWVDAHARPRDEVGASSAIALLTL